MTSTEYRGKALLSKDLAELFTNQLETDIVLLVGVSAKRFEAHSVILAARCPAMQDEISKGKQIMQKECSSTKQQLVYQDIDEKMFEKVLRYLYTGRIRLGSSYVFDILDVSFQLRLKRLQKTCESYIFRSADERHILSYVARASRSKCRAVSACLHHAMMRKLPNLFDDNSFLSAPKEMVELILRQDTLNVTESQIWSFLVQWGRYQIHPLSLTMEKEYSQEEREKLRDLLKDFARPNFLRLINVDVETVASKIESMNVFPRSEILKKYRFDALGPLNRFELAFPHPKADFFARIRECEEFHESEHPHGQGVDMSEMITMPSWTSFIQITFDAECELARYADLTFHLDESLSTTSASLRTLLRQRKKETERRDSKDAMRVTLSCRRLWFKFYSPHTFNPGWGYRFCVKSK